MSDGPRLRPSTTQIRRHNLVAGLRHAEATGSTWRPSLRAAAHRSSVLRAPCEGIEGADAVCKPHAIPDRASITDHQP